MKREIENLSATHPNIEVMETEDMKAFVCMVREVSKTYGTRDLTEEFIACNCWPLWDGWRISSWKDNEGGVPVLDFGSVFGITKDGKFLCEAFRLF